MLSKLMTNISTIAVDARTLTFKETGERGIGTYTTEHISAWAQLCPHIRFKLLTEKGSEFIRGDKLLSLPNISREYYSLGYSEFQGVDLFHIPDPISLIIGYDSPFRMAPAGIRSSMVFYDLIPLVMRQSVYDKWPKNFQSVYDARIRQIKDSNASVFAISECTKRDLVSLVGVPEERISVIMAGLTKQAEFNPTADQITEVKKRLGIDKPFLLVVGGIDEHKGFMQTLEASLPFVNAGQLQLVVVGSMIDPWKVQLKDALIRQGITGVIFTGFVNDYDLTCLYAGALALSFPSEYEGFGFPVLEAMAHGCPVICSNKASLPEVAGDAALYISDTTSQAVFNGLNQLLSAPALRDNLRVQGLSQSAKFSWRTVAERTVFAVGNS